MAGTAVAAPAGTIADEAPVRHLPRAVTLTGTWSLVRFIVRRDRLRLPVWIVGIVAVVLLTAVSVDDLYPTQADLDAAAAPVYDNAAVIALNGPTYGIDTLGGQIVFQVGSFGYVIVALMGMFLIGRHTRADEETGRTELLRAGVIGRNAPVTAALVVATGAFAVLGGLIAASLLSTGVPAAGSLLYGVAMGAFGLFFACVTAVTVQVAEHNRGALGLAGALLGGSYVVRAIGDIGSGALSWLSPMGWAQAARPFAGERWWTLALLVAGALALVALAFRLLGIRDLGGGLVPPRPGPPVASPSLSSPLGLAVRLQRASVVAWGAGLALTGVAYGSVGEDVGDLIGDDETFNDIIAQSVGSLTDSFFATAVQMIALIAGGFAISSVLRLRGEETADRAEPLLATAVPRARWAGSHLAVALAGSAALLVVSGVAMGVTYALVADDMGEVGRLTGAAVNFVPALWVLVGVAFALVGLVPRAAGAAWGVLVACFVIGMLGQLLGFPGWLMDLSPFQQVSSMPVEGFDLVPTAALVAVAAGLLAAGFAGLQRRDVGH